MENKLSKFIGKPKEQEISGQDVGGSFLCQHCDEVVSEAKLDYENQLLQWVCSSSHISKVAMDV